MVIYGCGVMFAMLMSRACLVVSDCSALCGKMQLGCGVLIIPADQDLTDWHCARLSCPMLEPHSADTAKP